MIFWASMTVSLQIKSAVNLYIQNDTDKTIEFDRNKLGILYTVTPGERKPPASEYLESLYAKYNDSTVYRKLDLGNSIKDAQGDIGSILHIISGTLYGVKVESIDKVYDNILIPLVAKMEY